MNLKQNTMKKLIVLVAICMGSFAAMAASPINVGIHGGISTTKMKVKDFAQIKSADSRTGYMVGAFARVNLGLIYLEPSFNFTHRESEINTITENGRLKVNSFDIPLMVGVKFLDLSVVKLRAFIGPVASFPGKAKHSLNSIAKLDTDNVVWNGKVGVGADVWKFTFDIDYEKAFKELGDDIKAPRSFNFTLGFKFI